MEIDVSQLQAEFGAYYKEGNANMTNLISQIYETTQTDELFKYYPTKSTVYESSFVDVGTLLQSYQHEFTETGADMRFVPRKTELARIKMDISIIPDEVVGEWAGFLADEGLDPSKYPLVAYALENHFLPKWKEDWENDAVYGGVFTAPTPGTANASNQVVDGIRKQINDSALIGGADNVQVIVTGAPSLDPETWVNQVEAFVQGIPTKFRKKIPYLNMNITLRDRFRKGMRAKYNMNYDQTSIDRVIDTNIMVKGLDSMTGSDKIWCSTPDNMRRPEKRSGNKNRVRMQLDRRKLLLMTDYFKAVAFKYMGFVWANDRDTV